MHTEKDILMKIIDIVDDAIENRYFTESAISEYWKLRNEYFMYYSEEVQFILESMRKLYTSEVYNANSHKGEKDHES